MTGEQSEHGYRLFAEDDLALYLRWKNQRAIWEVDDPDRFKVQTPASFADQWRRIVDWRRSWMICLDGREIGYLGFVSNEQDELTDEFFIVIGEVGEWRGGHGRTAMGWLFRKAASLGLRRLTGQVLGNNERALKFYTALGFEEVGRKEPYFERNGRTYATLKIEAAIPLERLRDT